MKKIILWAGILVTIAIAFVGFLALFQDSLIFFPRKTTDDRWKALIEEELKADYVSIRADDGAVLEGMFLSDHMGAPRPTIILFPGNAMLVEDIAPLFTRFPAQGISVLLMNYRGYGLSTGKPDLRWMKRDAEKIFDAASKHPAVDPKHITAWGISLGTGIAMHLASVKPVEKMILFSPYTSLADVAHSMFPFLPKALIKKFLKHDLDNLALASSLSEPLLIVHGQRDGQLSSDHAEKIAAAWGGEAELLILPERGHDDLWESEEMWNAVIAFVGAPR